jgi:hypothetical protein
VNIIVQRDYHAPETSTYRASTTGILSLAVGEQLCVTLEPTALMIPVGVYPVALLWSPRFQRNTPHLTVPGRSEIEIHGGNISTDSEGCILVAMKLVTLYEIQDAPPATSAIESALRAAEAAGESSTVTILDVKRPASQ